MGLFSGGSKAANAGTQYAVLGANMANAELDTGLKNLTSQYNDAQKYYQPYANTFGNASSMWANALGLNGAEGNQAATSAYQASPGYDFQVNQGLDALDRRAAARGMLGSGNTTTDTLNYAQGVANQDYNSWLDRLQTGNTLGLATAGQQAGLTTGIGDANFATGVSKANILNNLGQFSGGLQAQGIAQDSKANQGFYGGLMNLGSSLLGLGTSGGGTIGAKLLGF